MDHEKILNVINQTYELLIENDFDIIGESENEYIAMESDNIILRNALREIEKIIKDGTKSTG